MKFSLSHSLWNYSKEAQKETLTRTLYASMQRGKEGVPGRTGQVRGGDKPVYLRIVPYKTGCVDTPSSCINAWNAARRYTTPPSPFLLLLLPPPRAEPRYRHRGVNRSNLSVDTCPIRYLSIRLDKRTLAFRAEDNRFARTQLTRNSQFNIRLPFPFFFLFPRNTVSPVFQFQ